MSTKSDIQISKTINEISLGSDDSHKKIIKLSPELIPYRLAFCSYSAAMVATTVGFPLDSVKTRLQTHKFKSAWQCIVDTEKHEGIKGFYRGLLAPLLSSSAVRSVSVTVYSYSIPYWSKLWFSLYDAPKSKENLLSWITKTTPVTFSSGALAGSVCSVVSCPFEFTKLASQIEILVQRNAKISGGTTTPKVNGQVKSKGSLQIARELVKSGGLMSLYGGYRYHLLRDIFGSGIYFAVYENAKVAISQTLKSDKPHPISIAIGGALAGTVCWIAIYPLDTYKGIVQRDIYASTVDVSKQIMPRKSIKFSQVFHRRMYRGLGLSIARTSIIGMTFFSCYEQLVKWI